jgi:hypothetical protein
MSSLLIFIFQNVSFGNESTFEEIKNRGTTFINSLMKENFELLKKSRRSFLLPELSLDADKNRQDTVSIGTTGSGINTDLDNNNRIAYGGSLSWDFKGILYNDAEPKILKDIFNLYEFKLAKLNQITSLYFQKEALRIQEEKSDAEKIKLLELEERLRVLYEN